LIGDLGAAVGLIEAAIDSDADALGSPAPRELLQAAIALVETAATRLLHGFRGLERT
jgi:hypothetical protein